MTTPPPLTDAQLRFAVELLLENMKLTCIVIQGHRNLLAQMEQRGLFDSASARTSVSDLEQLEAYADQIKELLPLLKRQFGYPDQSA